MASAANAIAAVLGKPPLEPTAETSRIARHGKASAEQLVETPYGPIIVVQPLSSHLPKFFVREPRGTVPGMPVPSLEVCFGHPMADCPVVAVYPQRMYYNGSHLPNAHTYAQAMNAEHADLIRETDERLASFKWSGTGARPPFFAKRWPSLPAARVEQAAHIAAQKGGN
jgi:hypothetical protein